MKKSGFICYIIASLITGVLMIYWFFAYIDLISYQKKSIYLFLDPLLVVMFILALIGILAGVFNTAINIYRDMKISAFAYQKGLLKGFKMLAACCAYAIGCYFVRFHIALTGFFEGGEPLADALQDVLSMGFKAILILLMTVKLLELFEREHTIRKENDYRRLFKGISYNGEDLSK